jgi:beta-fructofuranosidase
MIALAYSKANGTPFVATGDKLLPLSPDVNGDSTLHLWIDGSVMETFIDKRQAITTRYYGAPDEVGEIQIVWSGPAASLKSMTISGIKSVSSDRLTT